MNHHNYILTTLIIGEGCQREGREGHSNSGVRDTNGEASGTSISRMTAI